MSHYSYRFRLHPSADQCSRLAQHFGVCRFVYNHFLDRRNRLYRENKEGSSYYKDSAELPKLKEKHEWVKDVNAQSLQQELKNLDTAFGRFFKKKAKFPKFHTKHRDTQAFRVPQKITISGDRLCIPKFREGIRVKLHRDVEGTIKHATVSRDRSGRYFVSICVEREIPKLKPVTMEVGVDLGIKTLVTCSDGKTYPNIRPYKTLEKRLTRIQRSLSRKVKGSSSRERARRNLAKIHAQIADIRSNHLHQTTRKMINENQVIVVEDLSVDGMLRNNRLSKAISDVSFAELVRQLEYKAAWYGRTLIKVDRWYPSSKTCNPCGYVKDDLILSDRTWTCPRCHICHDRDLNAAKNILAEGKRTAGTAGLAGGEVHKTSARKQPSAKPEVTKPRNAEAKRGK